MWMHRHQFTAAGFAECLERINVSLADALMKLFDRNIRREVLFHDELHESYRLREDRLGRAKPDPISNA